MLGKESQRNPDGTGVWTSIDLSVDKMQFVSKNPIFPVKAAKGTCKLVMARKCYYGETFPIET